VGRLSKILLQKSSCQLSRHYLNVFRIWVTQNLIVDAFLVAHVKGLLIESLCLLSVFLVLTYVVIQRPSTSEGKATKSEGTIPNVTVVVNNAYTNTHISCINYRDNKMINCCIYIFHKMFSTSWLVWTRFVRAKHECKIQSIYNRDESRNLLIQSTVYWS